MHDEKSAVGDDDGHCTVGVLHLVSQGVSDDMFYSDLRKRSPQVTFLHHDGDRGSLLAFSQSQNFASSPRSVTSWDFPRADSGSRGERNADSTYVGRRRSILVCAIHHRKGTRDGDARSCRGDRTQRAGHARTSTRHLFAPYLCAGTASFLTSSSDLSKFRLALCLCRRALMYCLFLSR